MKYLHKVLGVTILAVDVVGCVAISELIRSKMKEGKKRDIIENVSRALFNNTMASIAISVMNTPIDTKVEVPECCKIDDDEEKDKDKKKKKHHKKSKNKKHHSEREEFSSTQYAIIMMHHLLKFRLSTGSTQLKNWYDIIRNAQIELTKSPEWGCGDIDCMYSEAVKLYKEDAKNNPDLKSGLEHIPDECPWINLDLIYQTIDIMLAVIIPYDEDEKEKARLKERMELINKFDHGYKG